ncbi:MAG: cupin domain-containing protein [Xanthomonadales bacterium]|jgi:anti-sigma factor ChrR (cupin superfamily)|nr:cupin domain-containing protein [Xanthomonadales bacterium]
MNAENKSLNMDRTLRVVIETAAMNWGKSPAAGVWRKKLEREGGESGQVSSVVRYEPGSRFAEHRHPLGEEIYVLEGVFADEHGEYPVGSYLRNPPGSSHAPFSETGCELLVKLDQFDPQDKQRTCIRTAASDWFPGLVPGLSVIPLHSFGPENTALVRWAPGTYFNPHTHPGGEEIFVLDGTFEDEEGVYPQGTWLRNPRWSRHTPFSRNGCTIFVKTGFLS